MIRAMPEKRISRVDHQEKETQTENSPIHLSLLPGLSLYSRHSSLTTRPATEPKLVQFPHRVTLQASSNQAWSSHPESPSILGETRRTAGILVKMKERTQIRETKARASIHRVPLWTRGWKSLHIPSGTRVCRTPEMRTKMPNR